MVVNVWVGYPCDHVADGELGLTAPAQHQDRGFYSIASLGKYRHSKLEVWFLLNVCITFVPS